MVRGVDKYKGLSHLEITNRFLGTVSSSWGTAGNWSFGRVPTASPLDNVSIEANCTLNVSPTINNLIVFAGVTLTFGSTARTLTVNSNMNCLGTINMNSNASHVLTLRGQYNSCATLTTDSNNSTIVYDNIVTNSTRQIFGSLNYRNLSLTHNAGSGTSFSSFVPTGDIKVNNTYNQGSRCRSNFLSYNIEFAGNVILGSSNAAGERFTKLGSGTISIAGSMTSPGNTMIIDFPFGLELKGTFANSIASLSFQTNCLLIMTTVNKTFTTGSAVLTIPRVEIRVITVNKNGADAGITTVTDLSGDGTGGILNGNGKMSVTNNLGGVTYNP
jgi:hypothetical protein